MFYLIQRKVYVPTCCREGMINLDPLKFNLNNSLPQKDLELIQALKTGQKSALSKLYDRYGSVVYGWALKNLKNAQEAEDITQEVFVSFWHKNTYNPARGSLSSYLIVMTRSRCLDKLRSRTSRSKFLERWQNTTNQAFSRSAFEQVDIWDTSQHVQEALAELPEQQRKILEMAYYQDLSQSEIANSLNIPLGTVKTSARQALKKLREILFYLTQ